MNKRMNFEIPDQMTLIALLLSVMIGFGGKLAGDLKRDVRITLKRFIGSLLMTLFMSYMAFAVLHYNELYSLIFIVIPAAAFASDWLFMWADKNWNSVFNRILNVFVPDRTPRVDHEIQEPIDSETIEDE